MTKLHELAQRLGVELTYDELVHGVVSKYMRKQDKHDLEIAHEMLTKLPEEYSLTISKHRLTMSYAMAYYAKSPATKERFQILSAHSTFEEAVCALAERYLEWL